MQQRLQAFEREFDLPAQPVGGEDGLGAYPLFGSEVARIYLLLQRGCVGGGENQRIDGVEAFRASIWLR